MVFLCWDFPLNLELVFGVMRIFLVALLAFVAFSNAYNVGLHMKGPGKRLIKAIPQALVIGALATSTMATIVPQPVYAEFRAAQKRTYFRQTPKLIEGGKFLTGELKEAIDKEDYKVIAKMYEEYASKVIANRDNEVAQTDTYVNNKFYRPMTILAGSFAEKGTSVKQRTLMEQEVKFEEAMKLMQGTTKDMPGDGWFAAKIKQPTGAARKKQAQAALQAAKMSYNEFVNVMNKGLMMELNKLDTI